jgi:putative DNA primase/helicase
MTEKKIELYRGYVPTKNKECTMKFKGKTSDQLMKYEAVKKLPEYAGILADDIVLLDEDDPDQAEIMMNIVEGEQLNCKVIQTTRGKHELGLNNGGFTKCGEKVKLACGITADIKIGSKNSYEVLKFNDQARFCEWDIPEGGQYDPLPKYFLPVNSKMEFIGMKDGDGRDSALFSYILSLQSQGFSKDDIKECIRIINKYVLKDPLSLADIERITRDAAFEKPVFFQKGKFLHDALGNYMKSEYSMCKINGQIAIYQDGIYLTDHRLIESKMINAIPNLLSRQRQEVRSYLDVILENKESPCVNMIAFRNGIYDINTSQLLPFSPEYTITNKIPWDYNQNAYSELMDLTLNKIACNDPEIRRLLEECIGYCFYRENTLQKAFILTGKGANGKSTFLDVLKYLLGKENISVLDIDELSEKFSIASIAGKLANIGDDINDDCLQGKATSKFKMIITGNDIKAEYKGQQPFQFKPYAKLLFSANEIPRMKTKGLEAIKRRLVIIPFNAIFNKKDPDFDTRIEAKLKTQESIEYLIKLGVQGLQRALKNQSFSNSSKADRELNEFEMDNSPVLQFLSDLDRDDIVRHEPKEIHTRYEVFCHDNGFQSMTQRKLTEEINEKLRLYTEARTINGKSVRIFLDKENE